MPTVYGCTLQLRRSKPSTNICPQPSTMYLALVTARMKRVKWCDHERGVTPSIPKRPKFPRRDVPVSPLGEPEKSVFHPLRLHSHCYRYQANTTCRSRCVQNARINFVATALRCGRFYCTHISVTLSDWTGSSWDRAPRTHVLLSLLPCVGRSLIQKRPINP